MTKSISYLLQGLANYSTTIFADLTRTICCKISEASIYLDRKRKVTCHKVLKIIISMLCQPFRRHIPFKLHTDGMRSVLIGYTYITSYTVVAPSIKRKKFALLSGKKSNLHSILHCKLGGVSFANKPQPIDIEYMDILTAENLSSIQQNLGC